MWLVPKSGLQITRHMPLILRVKVLDTQYQGIWCLMAKLFAWVTILHTYDPVMDALVNERKCVQKNKKQQNAPAIDPANELQSD